MHEKGACVVLAARYTTWGRGGEPTHSGENGAVERILYYFDNNIVHPRAPQVD